MTEIPKQHYSIPTKVIPIEVAQDWLEENGIEATEHRIKSLAELLLSFYHSGTTQ